MTHQETHTSTGTLVSQQSETFDLADNETSVTDGVGDTTYYTYNADGKVTHQETWSADDVLVDETDFTYDRPVSWPPRRTAMATSRRMCATPTAPSSTTRRALPAAS